MSETVTPRTVIAQLVETLLHGHHGLSPTIVCRWLPLMLGLKGRNG